MLHNQNPDAVKVRTLIRDGARTPARHRLKLWRLLLLGRIEPLPNEGDTWLKRGLSGLGELTTNEKHVISMDVPRFEIQQKRHLVES
jgi:hypothetical protein